ncbi:MAG: biotin transporter BioY, partial [Spirochaetota bacterium]
TIYLVGVPWLRTVAGISWPTALGAGVVPFLVGDVIKIAAAVAAQRLILTRVHWLLPTAATRETERRAVQPSGAPDGAKRGAD